jgi:hypothetical protein
MFLLRAAPSECPTGCNNCDPVGSSTMRPALGLIFSAKRLPFVKHHMCSSEQILMLRLSTSIVLSRLGENPNPSGSGNSRSEFSEKGIDDALRRMKPHFTDKSPFENPPKMKEKIQWIEPKLVCGGGPLRNDGGRTARQTTFLGWRDDFE